MISPWFTKEYPITRGFQPNDPVNPHDGVDFASPIGDLIRAGLPGMVVESAPGYIRFRVADADVVIFHDQELTAGAWKPCQIGDVIGITGNVIPAGGGSTGPHTHIEVRPIGGGPHNVVDPTPYLFPPPPVQPPPTTTTQEDDMAIVTRTIAAGGHTSIAGLYNGVLPNRRIRQVWLALYADTADGPGPVPARVFTQGPGGNNGGQKSYTVPASAAQVDVPVDWLVGNFGLTVYNDGAQPLELSIKLEDS